MKTLTEWLKEHPKGTFAIAGRKIGTKSAWRRIVVFNENHQDIWVWIAQSKSGSLRDHAKVEARIDRRILADRCDPKVTTDLYEVLEPARG